MKLISLFFVSILYVLFIYLLSSFSSIVSIITLSGYTADIVFDAAYIVGILAFMLIYIIDLGRR